MKKKGELFLKNNRGEMTTEQIVILVILIASFAIILYFFVGLGFGSETEKDACHNSVVTRGSSVVPTDAVPLSCKRSYVCLSKDGSCEGMYKPKVEKVKSKEETYAVLANELADCWWMFGEGKINYVGSDLFKNWYCSMCSQVGFDDSMKDIFTDGTIDKKDLYYYMTSTNKSDSGITYAQYLYKTNDVDKLITTNQGAISFGTMDLNKQYYALTAIVSDVSDVGWVVTVGGSAAVITAGLIMSPLTGGATGAAAITFVTSALIGTAGVAGGYAGNYIASIVQGESGNDYISPTYIEVNSPEFNALKCDEITTAA